MLKFRTEVPSWQLDIISEYERVEKEILKLMKFAGLGKYRSKTPNKLSYDDWQEFNRRYDTLVRYSDSLYNSLNHYRLIVRDDHNDCNCYTEGE